MMQVNKSYFIISMSAFILICSSICLSCSDKSDVDKSTIDSLKTILIQNQYRHYVFRKDVNTIINTYSRGEHYSLPNNYGLPVVQSSKYYLWEQYGMINPNDIITCREQGGRDPEYVTISGLIETLNNSIFEKNLTTEIETEWNELVNKNKFNIMNEFHDGFAIYADDMPTFDGTSIGEFFNKNQILFASEIDSNMLHISAFIDVTKTGLCKVHIYGKNNPKADSLFVRLFEDAKNVEPAKIDGVRINYRFYRYFNFDKQSMLHHALRNPQ